MKEKIIEIAENLIRVRQLKEELNDKEYWIQKAAQETDFVPAEGDWIHIEVTLYFIEVRVHHKEYGGSRYWTNGVWSKDAFNLKFSIYEEMLAKGIVK